MIESRDFLDALTGYANSRTQGPQSSVERPIKLGTIDPYYTSGQARVLFDGESVVSSRGYTWASTYSPVPGDRVFLVPVGQSYIIAGTLKSTVPYSFQHAIPLASGYAEYTTGFHTPSFTKTASGMVKLVGLGKHSSITGLLADGTLLGTLPVGFRPLFNAVYPAMTGSGNAVGSIEVRTDGTIYTKNDVYGAWFSLSNISFPTTRLDWAYPALAAGWTLQGDYRYSGYAKDSTGKVWLTGTVSGTGAAKTADTSMFNLPVGFRPAQGFYTVGTASGTGSFAHFYANNSTGDVLWRTNSVSEVDVTVDGMALPDPNASWITPTMLNAWVSYGASNSPGYYKDSEGIVHMRGLVKTGTINASIMTLPAGYRPSKTIIRSTVSNALSARVDINSAGSVIPVTGSNVWFSLDNISFSAEA